MRYPVDSLVSFREVLPKKVNTDSKDRQRTSLSTTPTSTPLSFPPPTASGVYSGRRAEEGVGTSSKPGETRKWEVVRFAAMADHFFDFSPRRLGTDVDTLHEIVALPFLSDELLVGVPFPCVPSRGIRIPYPPPLRTLKWQ